MGGRSTRKLAIPIPTARNLDSAGWFTLSKESAMPEDNHRKPVGPEADAKGQSEGQHEGGRNDGVASADPRAISGKKSGDATFPLKQDKRKG